MDAPFTTTEVFEDPLLLPGLSELITDLAADDADETSCRMADDVPDNHQQPIQAGQSSLAQPFNSPPPPELMDWAHHQPLLSALASAYAERTEPIFVSPGHASQPGMTSIQQGHGAVYAAVTGSRRGRKPMPRLHDLQRRLDTLTDQFRRLNDENTFLKGKLKLLESVLPYRDSHIGFLAAAKNGQIPRSQVQYLQKGGPRGFTATTAYPPAPAAVPPAAAFTVAAPTLATAAGSGSFSSEISLSPPAVASGGSNHSVTSVAALVAAPPPSNVVVAVPPAIGSEMAVRAASACVVTEPAPLPDLGSRHKRLAEVYAEPNATSTTAKVAEASTAAMAITTGRSASTSAVAGGPSAGMMQDGVASGDHLTHGATCTPMCHTTVSGSWSMAPPGCLPEAAALLTLCPRPDGEVPTITPAAIEELKRVSAKDFQILYKHCVVQLSVLGIAAEVHGPSSPQHARLERFLERTFVFMDQINLLSPNCFVQSMYVNVETGEPERPSDDFWRTLGLSLKLNPQQLEEVRMVMVMHEMSMAPVARERLKLASELSASISAAMGQRPVSSGDVIKSLSEVDEVTERLRRNVIKEYQAQVDVSDFLCMR
ncbi:hypothetical protein Vretimale_10693 [Volvox reticuliferus]|uniref:Uncharacterized protein n=1 Tax=Volvox reticuliferus TaxID=1737510 RepID=A0A8J4FPX2_9CHLO|nr:hypothetical protein Vretifemale_13819 [Volvox reticuliferus]GIM06386.1 hypothetical protein Vretimale_10693 [Volvox reticuliferus]